MFDSCIPGRNRLLKCLMKLAQTFSAVVILMIVTLTAGVLALDMAGAEATGKRMPLFDGKTLEGWSVLKCEAVLDNGEILLKAGNGLVQTEKKYGDFILEYDWKALRQDRWDSGVYFRYDSVPANRPWPARYQVNLLKGMEGNVGSLKEARSSGLTQDGEWNRFKLTVWGTRAELEINGKPAWKADGLEGPRQGYIALQAEVPGGGQFRFRNIYITELPSRNGH